MTTPGGFRESAGRLERTALEELERSRGVGREAENEFFQRSLGFDAQAAAEESSRGIIGSLSGDLQKNLEFARGQAVGSGRLETGFFDEDRGRLFEDFNERVANAIARNALSAQQLNLANTQGIGQFGQQLGNRFVNLLGGSLDRATAQENAENRGGGLFGTLLGGALGLVGGPVASAAGGFIGNKLFPGDD